MLDDATGKIPRFQGTMCVRNRGIGRCLLLLLLVGSRVRNLGGYRAGTWPEETAKLYFKVAMKSLQGSGTGVRTQGRMK